MILSNIICRRAASGNTACPVPLAISTWRREGVPTPGGPGLQVLNVHSPKGVTSRPRGSRSRAVSPLPDHLWGQTSEETGPSFWPLTHSPWMLPAPGSCQSLEDGHHRPRLLF